MILLSRLNRKPVIVNAELIRSIEANPDTTITMLNGDRIIVREDVATVVNRAVDHARTIRSLVPASRDLVSSAIADRFPAVAANRPASEPAGSPAPSPAPAPAPEATTAAASGQSPATRASAA